MENDERKNRYFVVYYPKINIVISAAILFQWQYLLVKDGDKVKKKNIPGDFSGNPAFGLFGCCEYFISTDTRLLKYHSKEIKMVTPIEFVIVCK